MFKYQIRIIMNVLWTSRIRKETLALEKKLNSLNHPVTRHLHSQHLVIIVWTK